MNNKATYSIKSTSLLIKKCHVCGHLNETYKEPERCTDCKKSFLPSNYFNKVHAKNTEEFKQLFCEVHELHEDDLVKGHNVIW